MASKISLPPNLPWSWVIEALASSNQVDTSLLIDMVKKAPESSDDFGKNSREMVSLRILESLTVKGNQNPPEGQKIELDPSNDCEDVLRHIIEMSAIDHNTSASEMLNWDVPSFIVHKRASLPLHSLQKLKDAILEGSHSILTSLKERSGLAVRTQCDDNIPVNGANSNSLVHRLEESSRISKVTVPNGHLSSPSQNRDDESQENLPDSNLLPVETNVDQTTLDHGFDPHVEVAKKCVQDANFAGSAAVENSIASPKHGLTDTSEEVVGYAEKERCNLEKGVQIGSSIPQNRDGDLLENLLDKLPAKRDRVTTFAKNLEREMCKDQTPFDDVCDPHVVAAKKLKQDVSSTVDNVAEHSVVSAGHGLMILSAEGIVEHIESEGCNLEKPVQVGGVESNGSAHDNDNQHAASKRLVQSSDAFHHDHLLCPPQVLVDDTIVAKVSAELHGQNNDVDEANGRTVCFEQRTSNGTSSGVCIIEKSSLENPIHNFKDNLQQNSSAGGEAKDDFEHNPDFIMTSDSDEYHDERMDIASMKDAFLNSQCTYSQDSFATQAKYCVKCNKDGQLLVCSSNTCQLVVHESCLHSAANFDGNGNFYCPFCSYSRAISDYLQAKKKASFARKDLAIFIGSKAECQPKKFSMRLQQAKENQLRENDDLRNNGGNKDENFVNEISNPHNKENIEKKHQAEPPISSSGYYPHCGEKIENLTDGAPHVLVKGNLDRQGMGQECQSPRGHVEKQIDAESVHKSDSGCKGPDAINRKEQKTRARRMKISEMPEPALPHQPVCRPPSECSEEENEKPATGYSTRLRKPTMYTYPATPQLRRKTLTWTKLEEEKLKEGVETLSSPHDRSIPWKKILEFGGDVFQRGRTAIDLKDKWRNICRASPKSK